MSDPSCSAGAVASTARPSTTSSSATAPSSASCSPSSRWIPLWENNFQEEEHLKVEIVYAASSEGALHLTDALTRRTRISIEARDRGLTAAEPAARLMAPILGWDEARIQEEIELYRRRVAAEMTSQLMPDDVSSNQVRSSVRETSLP